MTGFMKALLLIAALFALALTLPMVYILYPGPTTGVFGILILISCALFIKDDL